MSLEVYFDNTLIDEQYYTGLTNNFELFNESFKLGATPVNTYKLKIAKEGVSTQPTSILLKDDGTTFASLEIDNIEEQDYEYVYTLTDKMINLEFYYDASEIFVGGSTTLYNIVMDICTKTGLILGTTNFRGYDKSINWYDNTRTARDYIGYIAELNGGFARIEGNTLYFIKQKTNSKATIDIDDCEDFKIGEKHNITRVVYELGALKYEFGDDTGNTLYLNSDNVYITEESEVEGIYNDINGFEFYSFTTSNCPINYDIKVGDVITFTDGTNEYATIAQYDLEYYGDWTGGYDLDINTEKQEETQIIGAKENIKNLRILVDRQNNIIQQTVEEVGQQNNKISQVTQTVDELNSKIQDIADITVERESYNARLEFENINQSEPISIEIYPTGTNISYLYPHEGLYPDDILYMPNRILRFIRTYEEDGQTLRENIDYELPDDLLYYDSQNYDRFYLNYDSQTCLVEKHCKYNADGTVGLLPGPLALSYPYPQISLGDGDYEVQLLGYNSAYMKIRLMAANIYTTQFATRAEVSSSITQTANEINLRVDEKLDEEDFTSANIMLRINNDESTATINADKINLNGAVTANDYFKINPDGSMEAKNGKFTGGQVLLSGGTVDNPNFSIQGSNYNEFVNIAPDGINFNSSDGGGYLRYSNRGSTIGQFEVGYSSGSSTGAILQLIPQTSRFNIYVDDVYVIQGNMHAQSYNYDSKESIKKNIEKYNHTVLDTIKNGQIYTYNFKTDKEGEKKYLGFIIGDEGGNYKTPFEVITNDNSGINVYNMASILWKGIQEQQEQIEQLQKEIKELKGEK